MPANISAAAAPRLSDQVAMRCVASTTVIAPKRLTCIGFAASLYFHKKRHPREMAEPEVAAFLTHLAVERRVSASTQNQALNAILFLYKQVLNREIGFVHGVVRAKRPERLPVALTREEVHVVRPAVGA